MLDLPGGCVRPVCHQGATVYVAVGRGVLITEEGWGRRAGQGGNRLSWSRRVVFFGENAVVLPFRVRPLCGLHEKTPGRNLAPRY